MDNKEQRQEKETRNNYLLIFVREIQAPDIEKCFFYIFLNFYRHRLITRNRNKRNNKKERNRNHKPQTLKSYYFYIFLNFYRHRLITIEQKQEKETRNNYLLIFVRDRNRNIRKFNERNNKYIFFASLLIILQGIQKIFLTILTKI